MLHFYTLDQFSTEYKSLLWFKPINRPHLHAHLECMYDMFKDELQENPELTVKEFTINILNDPEMQEVNEIMGIGLIPEKH